MFNGLAAAARRSALLCITAGALGAAAASHAARLVDPPSVEMTRAENNVVSATVVATPDPTHIIVQIREVLAGTGQGEITLRSDADVIDSLEPGDTYLFAFTRLASSAQFRDAKFMDPEGPKILTLRGLRTGAVFSDTPPMQLLFRRARGEAQPTDRERLDAVMAAMASEDRRTRGFAIEELFLRRELANAVVETDTRLLARLVADESVSTQLRQFILEAALAFPGGADQPWLVAADRQVLAATAPQMELTSEVPLLVVTALKGLAAHGDTDDLPAILPMLGANSPAVVTAALEAADGMDPEATMAAVQRVMDAQLLDEDVHPDSRRALERYFVETRLRASSTDRS